MPGFNDAVIENPACPGASVKVRVTPGELRGATASAIEAADRGARQAQATRAVKGDSFVQDLVNLFDGRVVDSTIREKQP